LYEYLQSFESLAKSKLYCFDLLSELNETVLFLKYLLSKDE